MPSFQENSYIGRIGKAMEPVIEPLGFDWKLGIGIPVSYTHLSAYDKAAAP